MAAECKIDSAISHSYTIKKLIRRPNASEHEGNVGTSAEAAKFGDVVFNCTHSLEVLRFIKRPEQKLTVSIGLL
jgi:hypothetical protein